MADQLVPIITDEGREALISGFANADNYRFSQVALGDANGDGYKPEPDMKVLVHEVQRVAVSSVVIQDHARLHITAVIGNPEDKDASEYNIHEIGFFLQGVGKDGQDIGDAVLFAVYATEPGENPLLSKDPATELLLAFDLVLPDIVEGELKFDKDSYLHLPEATQQSAGLLQIATKAEVTAGKADDKAVSPATMKSALAAFGDNLGKSELTATQVANKNEVKAGIVANKAVTPSTLTTAFKDFKKAQAAEPLNLDNVTANISLTVGNAKSRADGLAIQEGEGGKKEIFFADNGQIRSSDNNHRILFRRSEDILELREYGKIVLSPGAKKGTATATTTFHPSGNVTVKGHIKAEQFINTQPVYNPNHHRMYPDNPLVYQNIFDAVKKKAITKMGKPTFDNTGYTAAKPWHGKPIIKFGADTEKDGNGGKVTIPKGYDTVWLRVLGERWTAFKAYYLDGKKESLGLWTGGYRQTNCYSPDGSLADGRWIGGDNAALAHQWVPISVPRDGELGLVVKPQTNNSFWVSGLAFSQNPWNHSAVSAVTLHWKLNGGEAIKWNTHKWKGDILAQLEPAAVRTVMVPCMGDGQDKLLYLIEHNNDWNGGMHDGIKVNGKPIERFSATYDNPFARHWNSKLYNRYLAARIPASEIPQGFSYLKVEVDMVNSGHSIYLREMGTHNLMTPVA
ncbi:phage tail-collar fiber domain-containing protein [Teredinibacter purpureus]|uniref:phage tail-collar fiber domain-containing protein n=1 Tax=Teredinibacter purpureus TaxID=2731756 RepID=UPI0006986432|nr:phage tail protein [Teredinibacter purpureus]